ncbi:MAG: 30S ribosomal protein S6 [Candidatus Omnitrophica bacterium]|nr:30S ribosomal protein S6 [Candidatus Omnitrophota bacterium]
MNKYEAMFIIKPDLSEEERKTLFNQIGESITKNSGVVTQAAVWAERKKLYFPIKKFQEGLYYLVNFDLPAPGVKEIRQAYRINESILRVLVSRL